MPGLHTSGFRAAQCGREGRFQAAPAARNRIAALTVPGQARQSGLLIITIALDASKGDRQSQADFAKAADGRSLSYTQGELAYWYDEAGAGE